MISILFTKQIFTSLLVLIGSCVLLISIKNSRSIQNFVPIDFYRRWQVLTYLICFFFVGYIGYVFLQVTHVYFSLEVLTAVVFFGGALFVYGIVDLAGITIKQLHHGKESLEAMVAIRTEELVKMNSQLEQTKEEYLKQNTFLNNTLESLSHPFYVIDVNTYEVVLYNKASGFDGRKVTTCHQLTHNSILPCDGENHPCPIKEIKKTGRPTVLEHTHMDENVEPIHVEIHGYPIFDENGTLSLVIEYVHDITERKNAEKQLLKAKVEAESANKTNSEFLANISHEIRTPMSAILGMTDLILATELTQKQREHLNIIKNSSDLLLNLINDILDFSKLEAGKLQFDIRPFRPEDVITSTIKPLYHLAEDKGIALEVICAEETKNITLLGDDLRLRQILYNLVGNAIKFTVSGRVIVMCEKENDSYRDGVSLLFSVTDTGVGIERDHYEKIFESFRQADTRIARSHGGTGLGLSICKLLVELMGGHIWVESTVGMGSCFSFRLSFSSSQEGAFVDSVTEENDSVILEPLRILVVDDIGANRELARIILEQRRHIVREAENGLKALQILEKEFFDVILLDVQMPILDGMQVARYIRICENGNYQHINGSDHQALLERLAHRLQGSHVPLLALTARATSDDMDKCYAAGMDAYISKPFSPDEILWRIGEVLRNCEKSSAGK